MRELARRANVSHTWVSQVISGQSEPSWDFVASVARPLGMQPVEAFRLAGLLPHLPEWTRTRQELNEVLDLLSEQDQQFLLRLVRGLVLQTTPSNRQPADEKTP